MKQEKINKNENSSVDYTILLCIKNGIWFFIFLMFQAYINELEVEIVHLQKENARLKRQEKQVQTFRSLALLLVITYFFCFYIKDMVSVRFLLLKVDLCLIFSVWFLEDAVENGWSNSTPNKENTSTVLDISFLRKSTSHHGAEEKEKICTFLPKVNLAM